LKLVPSANIDMEITSSEAAVEEVSELLWYCCQETD